MYLLRTLYFILELSWFVWVPPPRAAVPLPLPGPVRHHLLALLLIHNLRIFLYLIHEFKSQASREQPQLSSPGSPTKTEASRPTWPTRGTTI